ncbi:MAG: DUF5106 domain-containing protein [Bacteroidales bacterium]|nr:DUF5106 domain-containing protein [Bacteroidales bacterium]
MKRTFIQALLIIACSYFVHAQQYDITVKPAGNKDTMLYLGRHYCDELQIMDSARRTASGSYRFRGTAPMKRGIYALVGQNRKKVLTDFIIDGRTTCTISGDSILSAESLKVRGSDANSRMFNYMAVEKQAKQEMDDIQKRKKAGDPKANDDEDALFKRMTAFETAERDPKHKNVYLDLVRICEPPTVPDTVSDKRAYYLFHYWDNLFDSDARSMSDVLLYSPQLFSKMNYYFFGLYYDVYNNNVDTVCAALDRLMDNIGDDTAMRRYVLEFITPRYFRSTRNIGWDAVWCHIAEKYYLADKCPWALPGTLHNMRFNYNKIRQSIIGAHGQELWMADTNQSNDPKDWISSHRFPQRYVILWFWDPDCGHCQKYSSELKAIYDSLLTAPDRRFEVYAVGYESDVDKWKKYVREHDFRWVNVGGTNVNIDYQEAYNVHGAPTMIILDENRDIIMNKVIPMNNLLRFLDDHEKRKK